MRTLRSIPVLNSAIQLIVVDSSNSINKDLVLNSTEHLNNVKYIYHPAEGIYFAQNMGISKADGEYILILNSGDILLGLTDSVLDSIKEEKIYVYNQEVRKENGSIFGVYVHRLPKMFPHQSMIVHRSYFSRYGLYPVDFKFNAEQIWMARIICKGDRYVQRDNVLSAFYLGGVSGEFNLKMFGENYAYYRILEKSIIMSFWMSYLRPTLRHLFGFIPRDYFLTYLIK